jgi:hypothetical protein
MKKIVFWDIITQFVPHRRHYVSTMFPASKCYVRSEVFAAVTIKNVVFWDIKPSSYFTVDTVPLCYRAQPVNAM